MIKLVGANNVTYEDNSIINCDNLFFKTKINWRWHQVCNETSKFDQPVILIYQAEKRNTRDTLK